MDLSERIKYLRKMTGLDQRGFGKLCGVSGSAVNHWELGNANIRMFRLKVMAERTGVPIEWLQSGVGPLPGKKTDGTLSFAETEGIDVPRIHAKDAALRILPERNAPKIKTKTHVSASSYHVVLDQSMSNDQYPGGTIMVFDPEPAPIAKDVVLAAYGEESAPVIGRLTYESSRAGEAVVVTPLNDGLAAARSDLGKLDIIAVLIESTRPEPSAMRSRPITKM
jgi:transcriptional regulator with XRE-family HTH domain